MNEITNGECRGDRARGGGRSCGEFSVCFSNVYLDYLTVWKPLKFEWFKSKIILINYLKFHFKIRWRNRNWIHSYFSNLFFLLKSGSI